MAHNLEILKSGQAALVYAGTTPWHELGTPMVDIDMYDVVKLAHMAGADFEVEKTPTYHLFNDEYREVPNIYNIRRVSDGKVFGQVKGAYTIYQNMTGILALTEALKDRPLAIETIGVLNDGKTWVLVRLDEDILVGGVDPIRPYVLLIVGHDGKTGVHLADVSTRVVCQNTMSVSLGESKRTVKASIKHLSTVEARVSEMIKALNLQSKRMIEQAKRFEILANTRKNPEEFESMIDFLIPIPTGKDITDRVIRSAQEERLRLWSVFQKSETVERDTAYGWYNAVTQWVSHDMQVKGMNTNSKNADSQTRRALYNLDGPGFDLRSKAFKHLMAGVK